MVHWTALALFMLSIGSLTLYGLSASGHFPAEFRTPEMRRGGGAVVLWVTILLAALAVTIALWLGVRVLPWYAVVIGGGMMLLFAPLALRVFPDRFVNGRGALLMFTAAAIAATGILWVVG